MKMSRFARSLTSLVLALIMIMSTSMSAFALWVPDSVLEKYEDVEDDEEEENEKTGSSIFDSVQSRLDDDDDDDDEDEKKTSSSKIRHRISALATISFK